MNRMTEAGSGVQRVVMVLGVLIATALVTACGDDHGDSHPHGEEGHAAHSEPAAPPAGLELNHGEKWAMDDHTRSSFAAMAASFLDPDRALDDVDDLKQAGAELQVQSQELIRGCTMSGAAHDQLHRFLTDFLPAVEGMAASGGDENVQKVRHDLERYGDFFE